MISDLTQSNESEVTVEMDPGTYYISICKNTIARNLKLSPDMRTPPVRMSRGKHGKPMHFWDFRLPMDAHNINVVSSGPQMPWGARVYISFDL